MSTITIRIECPEGARVHINEGGTAEATSAEGSEAVTRYWGYLSENGKSVYRAAAKLEREGSVPFTLEAVADELGVEYKSAQSMHRTAGRSARKWRDDTGTDEPIRLDWVEYEPADHGGMRTSYRLPTDVAEAIEQL